MKSTFTLIIIMSALVGLAKGQEKETKTKRLELRKDSVYAYQLIPYPGSPVISLMPIDTGANGNVKMPNSYRKQIIEPVPMPTHRLKLMMLKKRQKSSGKGSM
jgi:hypothetical protein